VTPRTAVGDVIAGAHRAVADWATDPLVGRAPTGTTFADEPLFDAVCQGLGYPTWPAGEPFPHRTVAGELATQAIDMGPLLADDDDHVCGDDFDPGYVRGVVDDDDEDWPEVDPLACIECREEPCQCPPALDIAEVAS
jgi:hypothetical protein